MSGERAVRWITISECARRLSLSESGVRKLVASGRIPAVHLANRSVRVDWRTLEGELERQISDMEGEDIRCGRNR